MLFPESPPPPKIKPNPLDLMPSVFMCAKKKKEEKKMPVDQFF